MALIIPTSYSSFGDSTKTTGPAQRYVLAQIRSDANLDWVRRVRALLVKAELKFDDVRQNKPRLRKDPVLWRQIENGVGQATIIVVDPQRVRADGARDASAGRYRKGGQRD